MKRLEAMEHFQRKIDENPMDSNAHHHFAVLAKAGGDQDTYARHSRIAWLTQQGGPAVSNELALSKLQSGQHEEAETLLRLTIARWPTFSPAYCNLAVLLAKRGQYTEALSHSVTALRLSPNDPSLHRNVAQVYEQLGRSSEALMHFQRALALVPDDAVVARRVALLSLGRGRTDVATQHYSRHRDLTGQHYDLKL
ncbi:putative UDP-N-acetylglucosamine--peptide N-acetylglucosaminyltransferase SEC [Phytophthora citrophthora]|uniref:UDP-N-acetylglucosamine--peptide N-acetylglucosaminyltransferase SEC n=1 Tax=Phytophthora citrophthora TaxID=4793 RepID=A0AAD9GW63_9STRA|nr:putative UDP-N-acetylglucosamine--peptide N-acetylglucosaminyltransferase SEC [Phytophthora citrophthora]